MIHEMKLQQIYFDKIKNGEKIYEIRLNDEKRQLIKIQDKILFKKEPLLQDSIIAHVKDLIHFSSFEQMINTLEPSKVGFENQSISEIIDIYHEFYSIENELNYGVLAIKIQVEN